MSELMEGFIPIVYATCIAFALNGPNTSILVNVGSTYWGEKIEDIGPLLFTMAVLFIFDTISVIVTSIILWKLANINMAQEFLDGINKYWLFLIIKIGIVVSSNFFLTDVNLGMDPTGNFDWITSEGRQRLIYNSTELTDDEKLMLLADTTFT